MGVVLATWGMVKMAPNGSHMTVHGDGGYIISVCYLLSCQKRCFGAFIKKKAEVWLQITATELKIAKCIQKFGSPGI